MAKRRKVPIRMCIGCREMKEKKEMIRIVKSPDGLINIDIKGKAQGRGAYICPQELCFDRVAENKLLEKTFKKQIEEDLYLKLKRQLKKGEQL
ncbi:MAG TPA: YlxR family protein [Bacillota bacterium]|nr:YlxR family protein [Bacillota bacterium]